MRNESKRLLGSGPRRLSWCIGGVGAAIWFVWLSLLLLTNWNDILEESWKKVAIFVGSFTAASFFLPWILVRAVFVGIAWTKQGFQSDHIGDADKGR